MTSPTLRVADYELSLDPSDLKGFEASLSAKMLEPGLHLVTLILSTPTPAVPPTVTLNWHHPAIDIQGQWQPNRDGIRALPPNWGRAAQSAATSGAPVLCLYNQAGQNRLTFACSDALNPVQYMAGLVEETAAFHCYLRFFSQPHPPITHYQVTLLLDRREIPFSQCLDNVQRWWAAQEGYQPSAVPGIARLPMYSTWYSFHQKLLVPQVVEQCRLAKQMGCEAVIVDDGWQTTDAGRGYAWCGDWRPERIGDMAGFVRAVHETGMKFILWYAVPFLGKHSQAFNRFEGKFLSYSDSTGAATLDPRYPDVREYLIDTYEQAMRDWDLDGFKLDFVDTFGRHPGQQPTAPGRDHESVPQAADRLLSDVMARLHRLKPEVMIEFRQSYIGPLMRKYGNMFRAGDCPNDAISNRVKTIDIRLLCGNTAAHADMLMWHPNEPTEVAALQLLNVLFAVPQISVLLDRIPPAHQRMLRFWLAFWRTHRDVLLEGKLRPLLPQALYPSVIADSANKRVVAVYDQTLASPGPQVPAQLFFVNATHLPRLVLELEEPLKERRLQTYDCQGQLLTDTRRAFPVGLHSLPVPPAGLVQLLSP